MKITDNNDNNDNYNNNGFISNKIIHSVKTETIWDECR